MTILQCLKVNRTAALSMLCVCLYSSGAVRICAVGSISAEHAGESASDTSWQWTSADDCRSASPSIAATVLIVLYGVSLQLLSLYMHSCLLFLPVHNL